MKLAGSWSKERIAASRAGEQRYASPERCGHGHVGEHYVSNGECVACCVERSARQYLRVREVPRPTPEVAHHLGRRCCGCARYIDGGYVIADGMRYCLDCRRVAA